MSLSSARRKLRWADRHFEVLKSELEMFSQSDCYSIRLDKDVEGSEDEIVYSWILDRLDPPPLHWSLLVGDLIHNLRSALDHAAWALVVAKKGEDFTQRRSRDIEFPIAKEPKYFESRKVLIFLDAPMRAAFKAAQPYEVTRDSPERDPLWGLQHAWSTDKHWALSVIHMIAVESTATPRPYLAGGKLTMKSGSLQQGAEVVRFTAPRQGPHAKVEVDLNLVMEIGVKNTARGPGFSLEAASTPCVSGSRPSWSLSASEDSGLSSTLAVCPSDGGFIQ